MLRITLRAAAIAASMLLAACQPVARELPPTRTPLTLPTLRPSSPSVQQAAAGPTMTPTTPAAGFTPPPAPAAGGQGPQEAAPGVSSAAAGQTPPYTSPEGAVSDLVPITAEAAVVDVFPMPPEAGAPASPTPTADGTELILPVTLLETPTPQTVQGLPVDIFVQPPAIIELPTPDCVISVSSGESNCELREWAPTATATPTQQPATVTPTAAEPPPAEPPPAELAPIETVEPTPEEPPPADEGS